MGYWQGDIPKGTYVVVSGNGWRGGYYKDLPETNNKQWPEKKSVAEGLLANLKIMRAQCPDKELDAGIADLSAYIESFGE